MTTDLVKGANAPLRRLDGSAITRLLVGISWANVQADVDLCALLCDDQRKVLSDEHFLFWHNQRSPALDAFLLVCPPGGPSSQPDRAQLVINLEAVEPSIQRVFVSLSTIAEGASLTGLAPVTVRAVDLGDGTEAFRYSNRDGYTQETCVVMAEVYRHKGDWKFRVVDQGYANGLAALGREYGVEIE